MDSSWPKPPLREKTLEEVRQGLLRDANAPNVSFATAQHYRKLAELIRLQVPPSSLTGEKSAETTLKR